MKSFLFMKAQEYSFKYLDEKENVLKKIIKLSVLGSGVLSGRKFCFECFAVNSLIHNNYIMSPSWI